MDFKKKYLIYKQKYLSLKKQNQIGGTIEDVYLYLEENSTKINPRHFEILQEFAYTFLTTNPHITVAEFISQVYTNYNIVLPSANIRYRGQNSKGLFNSHLFKPDTLVPHTAVSSASKIRSTEMRTSILAPENRRHIEQSSKGLFNSHLFKPDTLVPHTSTSVPHTSVPPTSNPEDLFRDMLGVEQANRNSERNEDEELFRDMTGFNSRPSTPLRVVENTPRMDITRQTISNDRPNNVNMFRDFERFLNREYPQSATGPIPQFEHHLRIDNDNLITVYTTGVAYFENDEGIHFIRALMDNIIETCERAGKRVRFIHYDMFDDLTPRYNRDEIFINGYLTLDIIRSQLENNPNALLVDIAHIIHYYRNPYSVPGTKPLMKYYSYRDTISPHFNNSIDIPLNINCFYPGFIGDMNNLNYIRLFKFFQFENNNIVTYIQKGIDRNIKIREIYRGDTTTFVDFTIHKIDINGLIANIRSPRELNAIFWE